MVDLLWWNLLVQSLGQFQQEVVSTLFLGDIQISFLTHCRISWWQSLCQKPAWSVHPFQKNSDLWKTDGHQGIAYTALAQCCCVGQNQWRISVTATCLWTDQSQPVDMTGSVNCKICRRIYAMLPSLLWCCWLGDRKGIQPVKNWVVGCWCGYVSGSRCRFAHGPADATATKYLLLQ